MPSRKVPRPPARRSSRAVATPPPPPSQPPVPQKLHDVPKAVPEAMESILKLIVRRQEK